MDQGIERGLPQGFTIHRTLALIRQVLYGGKRFKSSTPVPCPRRLADRFIGDPHFIQDVLSESRIRFDRNQHRARKEVLYFEGIVRTVTFELAKKLSRRHGVEDVGSEEDVAGSRNHRRLPAADAADLRVRVRDAIKQLDPLYREVLDLVLEHTGPEIAQLLRIPESTARVRLHRAHKQLRARLGIRQSKKK